MNSVHMNNTNAPCHCSRDLGFCIEFSDAILSSRHDRDLNTVVSCLLHLVFTLDGEIHERQRTVTSQLAGDDYAGTFEGRP